MKKVIFVFIGIVALTGCSSPKKKSLGAETGWLCTTKENAKQTGFKPIQVPGKKSGTCVEMKADRDPYWDFYIRDYERKELPDMPETP